MMHCLSVTQMIQCVHDYRMEHPQHSRGVRQNGKGKGGLAGSEPSAVHNRIGHGGYQWR